MRVLVAVAVTLLALARFAHAGLICPHDASGNDDPAATVKALEQLAAGTGSADDLQYAAYCVGGPASHPVTARVVAACEKIVHADASRADFCMVLAARVGAPKLAGRDVFEFVAKQPRRPWDEYWLGPQSGLFLLGDLGDPRGAALVIATWKESIPRAAAFERRHIGMTEWSSWRQNAAQVLGGIGNEDAAAFLDEQAKATVDTHVADACRGAAAKIRAR